MARRAALFCLALVALALIPYSAQAASAPATSKGKKGGKSVCSIVDTCALHTDVEHAEFKEAVDADKDENKKFNKEVFGSVTSRYTLGINNPCVTIINTAGFVSTCNGPTLNNVITDPPARVIAEVVCPPGDDGRVGSVIELLCIGFLTSGDGSFVRELPTFRSGVFQGVAFCEVEVTNAMTTGQIVGIGSLVKCSRFRKGGAAQSAKLTLADFGVTGAP